MYTYTDPEIKLTKSNVTYQRTSKSIKMCQMLKSQTGLTGVDGGAVSVASDTDGEDRFIGIVDGDLCCSVAVHRDLIGTAADQLTVGTRGHACGGRLRKRRL